ncbi:MAG: DUF4911 domain-containing protein [Deltaproteobacteria bacterium]|nr:DUF4911 domain-containing protein [Deltaproteobacteria bacterium]
MKIRPEDTRQFRYLLEAYDNLAYSSVVERKGCILKVVFAPGQRGQVLRVLDEIRSGLDLEVLDLALT